ncbi:MAG: YceI family protein [Planctomycetes bacterium]|nr:YceI family protein [Planctomycetota bacterium]
MKLLLPLASAGAVALTLALATAPSAAALAPAPAPAAAAAPVTLTIDGVHSSMIFRIQHMDTAWFYGRFNRFGGKIQFDEEKPENSSVEFTVDATSVDTNSEQRDTHVKSPDFLDAKQFPELKFVSESVSREGGVWKASGKLTAHGVTKPLTIEFEKSGESKGRGGERVVGFHTHFDFDRNDFGITYGEGALGKRVELWVSLETKAE